MRETENSRSSRAVPLPRSNPMQGHIRGLAQSGSASALGAEGRWFESSISDQNLLTFGFIYDSMIKNKVKNYDNS